MTSPYDLDMDKIRAGDLDELVRVRAMMANPPIVALRDVAPLLEYTSVPDRPQASIEERFAFIVASMREKAPQLFPPFSSPLAAAPLPSVHVVDGVDVTATPATTTTTATVITPPTSPFPRTFPSSRVVSPGPSRSLPRRDKGKRHRTDIDDIEEMRERERREREDRRYREEERERERELEREAERERQAEIERRVREIQERIAREAAAQLARETEHLLRGLTGPVGRQPSRHVSPPSRRHRLSTSRPPTDRSDLDVHHHHRHHHRSDRSHPPRRHSTRRRSPRPRSPSPAGIDGEWLSTRGGEQRGPAERLRLDRDRWPVGEDRKKVQHRIRSACAIFFPKFAFWRVESKDKENMRNFSADVRAPWKNGLELSEEYITMKAARCLKDKRYQLKLKVKEAYDPRERTYKRPSLMNEETFITVRQDILVS